MLYNKIERTATIRIKVILGKAGQWSGTEHTLA